MMENDPVEEGWPGRSREGRQQIPHLRSSSPRPNRIPPLRLYLLLIVCLAFRFLHKLL
jgi:hypothetical protein